MAQKAKPGPDSNHSAGEHRSFRLDAERIGLIADIASGSEEGDAGLKSCALADFSAKVVVGLTEAETKAHHRSAATVVDDWDEFFNRVGDYAAEGFSFEEIHRLVKMPDGDVHLLALENWIERLRLRCNANVTPTRWQGSRDHEKRRRARRALEAMKFDWDGRPSAAGVSDVAVLHIVYGLQDPFVRSLSPDVRAAFGREFAPIARYTDTVEAKRQELVRAEALRAATGPMADGEGAGVVDLNRHRERSRWAERVISSGDALRAATAPARARATDEPTEQYRERVSSPWKAAREVFITGVRIDANRMLTEASTAFADAWRRS